MNKENIWEILLGLFTIIAWINLIGDCMVKGVELLVWLLNN
jgi:hypothetical protein